MTVREIAQGSQQGSAKIKVDGPAQINFREITLPPGASTGKHCHYGQVIAVVKRGTLTLYAPTYPTGVHSYSAGESITEGSGYIHEGRNESSDDVVLWATYVTPKDKPLAEPDLNKCEATQ